MTPAGVVTHFRAVYGKPHAIVSFDGALWYLTDTRLVRMATDGTVTRFIDSLGDSRADLTVGPDQALWVSQSCCYSVVRVDADGSQSPIDLGPTVHLTSITTGGDGSVWVAEQTSQSLLRVNLAEMPLVQGRALCASSNNFTGVVASFGNAQTPGTASDYTAFIDWGDGMPESDTGTAVARAGGGFDITASHSWSPLRPLPVRVRIYSVVLPGPYYTYVGEAASRFIPVPGTLAAPVQVCATRSAVATVSGLYDESTIVWSANNATISGSGATISFRPISRDQAVTLTATISTQGACSRVLTKVIPVSNCPSSGDLDGDGRAEIVWRHEAAGGNAYWRLNGTQITDSGYLPELPAPWKLAALHDVSDDGRADMIWYHPDQREVRAWAMNGSVVTRSALLATVNSGQTLEAAADFDGDSDVDLLLRNRSTNETFVQLLGAGSMPPVMIAMPPPAWKLQGAGDFNGDGKTDLLWHNSQTFSAAVWLMNGTAILAAGNVASPHSIWSIRGMGDIDGDGRSDIIWRNTETNQVVAWLMNGMAILRTGYLATPSAQWDLRAIGDFDGDGRADAMWRHGTTGDNAIWLLNGTALKAAAYVTQIPDLNWMVAGPR
ncbi:MAG TPA: VCBS repeat-containing protein [Thermoanaerobaculia bacterium]|jgi:hypothetical protein